MKLISKLMLGAAALALSSATLQAKELTFGMQDNEVSNVYRGAQAFQEKLAEISGGEMTVKIFPSSQLRSPIASCRSSSPSVSTRR